MSSSDSTSTGNSMPALAVREVESSSDDDGSMPGLLNRGNDFSDDSNTEDDSDEVPALLERQDDDSSVSSDDAPPLIHRRDNESGDESSSDSVPDLMQRNGNSSDSSNASSNDRPAFGGIPTGTARRRRNSSDDDSSVSSVSSVEVHPSLKTRRNRKRGKKKPNRRKANQEAQRKAKAKREAEEAKAKREEEAKAEREAAAAAARAKREEQTRAKLRAKMEAEERRKREKLENESARKIVKYIGQRGAQIKLRELKTSSPYLIWKPLLDGIMDLEMKKTKFEAAKPWSDLKRDTVIVIQEELDFVGDAALQANPSEKEEMGSDRELEILPLKSQSSKTTKMVERQQKVNTIQVTADVLRWLRQQKTKTYHEMFANRLKQLANGETSKCVKKRLKGSKRSVYESKLDKGQRIIFTHRETSILIWFVCQHDHINKCMRRVDLSYARVDKGDIAESLLVDDGASPFDEDTIDDTEENTNRKEPEMLASPYSNVPLKIHSLETGEIDKLVGEEMWTPPIKLTRQEEEIVKKQGTVLLLGRSGTGKTLCVCNRIHRDRQELPQARQLFVARTRRLCSFVKTLVQKTTALRDRIEFKRVDDWVQELIQNSADHGLFLEHTHVTYRHFCDIWKDICGDEKDLKQLEVWTQIRSFIKGSFESAQKNGPLSETEYVVNLAKDRCRLDEETRRKAYKIFLRYQQKLEDNQWWDGMDRVTHAVQLMAKQRTTEKPLYGRIYVDEVQDITQAEIGLLFLVSGAEPDSLFLAGDPAQAVAQGVDFRFEEVRSVVHLITSGHQKVEKWQKLFHNFRSHEGILRVANQVLDCMHSAFPSAAIKLKPDEGLVMGPRPGLLRAKEEEIHEFLKKSNRVRVLVRDEYKDKYSKDEKGKGKFKFADFGIIEAKGLEFSDVLIVDFFKECDEELQKDWKKLFQRMKSKSKILEGEFPNRLELDLKLLYTAITRAQNRLYFVETEMSDAYAFWKRLLTPNLAEKAEWNSLLAEGAKLMTADEWRVEGIEMAMLAEEKEDSDDPTKMLVRAISHFENAGDKGMKARAKAKLDALKLEHKAQEGFLSKSEQAVQNASLAIEAYVKAGLVEDAKSACKRFCTDDGLTGLPNRIDRLFGSSGSESKL